MLSPEARAQLEAQRRKYIGSLSAKRSAIESDWGMIRAGSTHTAEFERLKTAIHRLAGSAGSYGLDEVGELALQLDGRLAAGREQIDSAGFSELVDRLLAALDTAAN